MILMIRNTVDEFVPGCDWTVVRLDETVIDAIRRRAIACQTVRMADESAAEIRYWDPNATCVGTPDPETEESVETALDHGNGWAVLDDGDLGDFRPAKTDCTQMIVSAGASPSVAWSFRVGSEPIRTTDVPLVVLRRRIGSPLGDSLKDV